ncbi:uncharacterized protein LOC141898302 [Tubulanus polymorphus]|uniref:uncharacterized protein LOC141898302 n=1 Tax=Tubulanus polymorphus TaxID=672921 RepID=UPI003DA20D12
MSKFCACFRQPVQELHVLDFRHCSLATVPSEVFSWERTLEELYVDANEIRDLPRELFHCHGIRKFSVSDNDLQTIPPAIASLINLEELDISKNGIVELPENIKGCKRLSIVEASVNPLGRLPDGFTQLLNLTQLFLNDTFLDYLPGNFGRLSKLKILEVRENHLKTLPKSMCRLIELERLDIGQNDLTELPEVIGSLPGLLELWCDCNQITALPAAIGNLKQLMYIDASKNRIDTLPPEIEGCVSLSDLHLSTNCLKHMPETIGRLSNLTTLKVDDNQLVALPFSIGGLVSLSELNIGCNELQDLPPSIGLLRHLRTFYADENFIEILPPELGSCGGLTVLSLRCNKLQYVPDEIGRIPRLRVLNLSDNQLLFLPFSFTRLKQLQALWLSENQAQPLIPLQTDVDPLTGQRTLTCYLFPQQPTQDQSYPYDDGASFHASMWDEERTRRQQIQFDAATDERPEGKILLAANTPYPKANPRHNRNLALHNQSKSDSSQISADNPTYGAIESHNRENVILGGGSPTSPLLQERHFLIKHDKEKQVKDKARIQQQRTLRESMEELDQATGSTEQLDGKNRKKDSKGKSKEKSKTQSKEEQNGFKSAGRDDRKVRSQGMNSSLPVTALSPINTDHNHSISDFRQVQPNSRNVFQPRPGQLIRDSHSDYALQNIPKYPQMSSPYNYPPSNASSSKPSSSRSQQMSHHRNYHVARPHHHHHHHMNHHRSNRSRRFRDYDSDTGYRSDSAGYRSDSAGYHIQKQMHRPQRRRSDCEPAGYSSDWDGSVCLMRSPHSSKSTSNRASGYSSDTGHMRAKYVNNNDRVASFENLKNRRAQSGEQASSKNSFANNLLSDQLYDANRVQAGVAQIVPPLPPRSPNSKSLTNIADTGATDHAAQLRRNSDFGVTRNYPGHNATGKPSPLQHQRLMDLSNVSSPTPSEDEVFRTGGTPNSVNHRQPSESPDRELSRYMSRQDSPSMAMIPEHRLPVEIPQRKQNTNNLNVAGVNDAIKSPTHYEEISAYKNNNDLPTSQVSSSDSGYHGNGLAERMQELRMGGSPMVPPPSRTPPSPPQQYRPMPPGGTTPSYRDSPTSANYSREGTPSRAVESRSDGAQNLSKRNKDFGNWQKMAVNIVKNPGLGFSIAGGVGSSRNPFRPTDDGIFITKVQPNGPAAAKLRPGDKLIQVNGVDFMNVDHHKAVNVLKGSCKSVTMIIERDVVV